MSKSKVTIFTQAEYLAFAQYFGLNPGDASFDDGDIERAITQLGFEDAYGWEWGAEYAVAAIALEPINQRLAHWCVKYQHQDGSAELVEGRTDYKSGEDKIVSLAPLHLFSINWADTAPGIDWPEQYYLTWIPLFDRFLVTASVDTTDVHPYCDRALGHFSKQVNPETQALEFVGNEWKRQTEEGAQDRWEYLTSWDRCSVEDIEALADSIWPGEQVR